jgi:cytochrome c oxidase subunit 2
MKKLIIFKIVCNIFKPLLFLYFIYMIYECFNTSKAQLGNPAFVTAQGELIHSFYNYVMTYNSVILAFTFTWAIRHLFLCRKFSRVSRNYTSNSTLEMFFTLVPITILSFIGAPSISLMFMLEEHIGHALFINVIGHQWWWEYELPNLKYNEAESKEAEGEWNEMWEQPMIKKETEVEEWEEYEEGFEWDGKFIIEQFYEWEEDLPLGQKWLYECEEPLLLPIGIKIKLNVTSEDVIHSWTVRGFGIKTDAVPGRLNSIAFVIKRCGMYFGMCSEICGHYHAFMPINITAVNAETFLHFSQE